MSVDRGTTWCDVDFHDWFYVRDGDDVAAVCENCGRWETGDEHLARKSKTVVEAWGQLHVAFRRLGYAIQVAAKQDARRVRRWVRRDREDS